jgi:dolichol-phosphate mannosyltransferase
MQSDKSNTYSIILPTFNEAGHIKNLIEDIYKIFFNKKLEFEIIVVDDGSNDGTIEQINKLKNSISNLNLIVRSDYKNSLVDSLNAGIDTSKYNNIIWLDADYSHPPIYMDEIIKKNNENKYDLIFFSRFLAESKRYYHDTKYKQKSIDRLSIFLNKMCNFFLFNDLYDYSSGYISIKKNFFKKNKLKGYYGDYFIRLLVDAKNNELKIIELPFVELDRRSGISKTTGNKFDLIMKCFFYLSSIFFNFFRKFKFKNS